MNYNLVIDTSNFKPFDISPTLLILHDYRDAYNRLDELMNKIAEEKGEYVLPESSPYRLIMDKYNADFDAAASDFYNGMTTENARNIRDIRKRYSSEISPIRRMAESYNKYNDKLVALGPDAILGNAYKLEDFYGGINPLIEYRSAKDIQSTAAGIMLGLDNALMSAPELAGSIAKLYFVLRQQGLDGSKALATILHHNPMDTLTAKDASLLVQALDSVYNTYSKDSFSNDAKNKIWENTVLGAIRGILAPKYSMQHDSSYLNPALSYALQQALKEDRFKYEYDPKTGEIRNYNNAYLEGRYSSRRDSTPATPTEYERVPKAGKFEPIGNGKVENTSGEPTVVSIDKVPTHIKQRHPEGTVFLEHKNNKGVVIGYTPISYTVKKKVLTTQGSALIDVAPGKSREDLEDLGEVD